LASISPIGEYLSPIGEYLSPIGEYLSPIQLRSEMDDETKLRFVKEIMKEAGFDIEPLDEYVWERYQLGGAPVWKLTLKPEILEQHPHSPRVFCSCLSDVDTEEDADLALCKLWERRFAKKETINSFEKLYQWLDEQRTGKTLPERAAEVKVLLEQKSGSALDRLRAAQALLHAQEEGKDYNRENPSYLHFSDLWSAVHDAFLPPPFATNPDEALQEAIEAADRCMLPPMDQVRRRRIGHNKEK
jgi:hypothetical protein